MYCLTFMDKTEIRTVSKLGLKIDVLYINRD